METVVAGLVTDTLSRSALLLSDFSPMLGLAFGLAFAGGVIALFVSIMRGGM